MLYRESPSHTDSPRALPEATLGFEFCRIVNYPEKVRFIRVHDMRSSLFESIQGSNHYIAFSIVERVYDEAWYAISYATLCAALPLPVRQNPSYAMRQSLNCYPSITSITKLLVVAFLSFARSSASFRGQICHF
jgi:hypothetical protein